MVFNELTKLKNFTFEFYETLVKYFKMKDIDSKMCPVMSPTTAASGVGGVSATSVMEFEGAELIEGRFLNKML